MPKERRFYSERGEIKATNNGCKSREKKKEMMTPLARKSTSVLSMKAKDSKSSSLRRKDLKSLMYLHNNIKEDTKPIGLKSCLSSQKQCDKIKMKVKFYLKKDNKLSHTPRTKSAHNLNKKNAKSLEFESNALHKTKIKFSKKHMAGDSNCMQIDIKPKKRQHIEKTEHKTFMNSSSLKRTLARTMKNMIIEKSKQMSDTSLRQKRKSLKLKDTSSYSSITKYEEFKSRLNKSNIKSQLLNNGAVKPVENTSSRKILYNGKYQMTSVKHEDRLGASLSMSAARKIQSFSNKTGHINNTNVKNVRECGKNATKLDSDKVKSNLSAVFFQDVCVTRKKLKLWKNDHTRRCPISLQIGRKQTSPVHGSDNNKPSAFKQTSKIKRVQTFCGHEERIGTKIREKNLISLDSFQYPEKLNREYLRNKLHQSFSNTPSTVIRLNECNNQPSDNFFGNAEDSIDDCFGHNDKPKIKSKKSIQFNEDNKYATPRHKPNFKLKTPPKVILKPTKRELWDDLLDSSNRARNQEEDLFQKLPYQKERPLVIKDTLENLHTKKKKKIEWLDMVEKSKQEAQKSSRRSRSSLTIPNNLSKKLSNIFSKMSPRKNKSLPKIKQPTGSILRLPIKENLPSEEQTSVLEEQTNSSDEENIDNDCSNENEFMDKNKKECACTIHSKKHRHIHEASSDTADLKLAENKMDFACGRDLCQTSESLEKAIEKLNIEANRRFLYDELITSEAGVWTQTIPETEKRYAQTGLQTSNSIHKSERSQSGLSRNTSNSKPPTFISSKYFDKNTFTRDTQDISVGSDYSNKELRLSSSNIDYKIIRYRRSSANDQPLIRSKQPTIQHDISNKMEKSKKKYSDISTECKQLSNFTTASIERVDTSNVRKQYSNSTNFPEKYFNFDKQVEKSFPKDHSHSNNSLYMHKGRRLSDKSIKADRSVQFFKEQNENIRDIKFRELPYETKKYEKEQNYNYKDNTIQINPLDKYVQNATLREGFSGEQIMLSKEGSRGSILAKNRLSRQSSVRQYRDLPNIYADRSTTMIKNQITEPIRERGNIKTANAPTSTSKLHEILPRTPCITCDESRSSKRINKSVKSEASSIDSLQSNIRYYNKSASNASKQVSPKYSMQSNQTLQEESNITLKEEFLEEKSLQTIKPGVSIKVPPVKLNMIREKQMRSKSTIKKLWYRFLEVPKPANNFPPDEIKNITVTYDSKPPVDSLSKKRKHNVRPVRRNENGRDATSEMQPIRSDYRIKIQNVIAPQNTNLPDKSLSIKKPRENVNFFFRKPKSDKRTDTSRLNIKKKTKSSQHEHNTVLNKVWSMLSVKRRRMDTNRRKVKQQEKNNLKKKRIKDKLKGKKEELANETASLKKQFFVYNEAQDKHKYVSGKNKLESELTDSNNWAQKIRNLVFKVLPIKKQTKTRSSHRLKEPMEIRALETRLDRQRISEDKSIYSSKKYASGKLQYIAPDQIISEIRNVNTGVKRFCLSPDTKLKNIEPLIRSINPNKVRFELKNNRRELQFIHDNKNKPRDVNKRPCACSFPPNKNVNKFTTPHAGDKWILPDCPKSDTPAKVPASETKSLETKAPLTKTPKTSKSCICDHKIECLRKISDNLSHMAKGRLFPGHNDCSCPKPPPQQPGRLHLSNRPSDCIPMIRKSDSVCECKGKSKSNSKTIVTKPGAKIKGGNACLCSLRNVCECFDKPLSCICKCREALIKRKKPKAKKKKAPKIDKKKQKKKEKKPKKTKKKPKKKPKKKGKKKAKKKGKKKGKKKAKKKTKKKSKIKKPINAILKRKRKKGLLVRLQSSTRRLAKISEKLNCDDLFLHTLRKHPCLIVYKMFPYAYPHVLNCMTTFKHIFRVFLFTVAFVTWIPCILTLYAVKIMVCNC